MDQQVVFEPKSQGVILFYGKEIIQAHLEDNRAFVSVSSLAEVFEINRNTFQQRLRRSEYFQPYSAMIYLQTKGGKQAQLCLMTAVVPTFLSGTDLGRVQSKKGKELMGLFLDEVMDILAKNFGISEKGEL